MSITDTILRRYGMLWELGPYRIINKYGVIVQKAHFDLRDCTLKAQENLGKSRPKFQKSSPSTFDIKLGP